MSKTKKTILIFGVSSFVGSSLAEFFKKHFKVAGTTHATPVKIQGVPVIMCDVLKRDEVQLAMYTFRPDYAIYAAGLPSLMDCAEAKLLADALNAGGLYNVSEACQRFKAQLVYLSSSYVFAGEEKYYVENDIPDPITMMGKTKAAAEFYIQRTSLNYLIFRSCQLYGHGYHPLSLNFFERLQRCMGKNQNIMCDNHIHIGFLDVMYLALIIKLCLERDISNRLFQVNSSDVMTHYEFAKAYCKVFGDADINLEKGRWFFPLIETARDIDLSKDLWYRLDVTNIESFLTIKMPTIMESLKFSYKRFGGEPQKDGKRQQSGDLTYI